MVQSIHLKPYFAQLQTNLPVGSPSQVLRHAGPSRQRDLNPVHFPILAETIVSFSDWGAIISIITVPDCFDSSVQETHKKSLGNTSSRCLHSFPPGTNPLIGHPINPINDFVCGFKVINSCFYISSWDRLIRKYITHISRNIPMYINSASQIHRLIFSVSLNISLYFR